MINPFTDEYFMKKLCRKLKWLLIKAKFPLGLLLSSMIVIARSHNLTKLLNDVTAHAEMQAITAAANYLEEIFSRLHALRHLEPCQMCAGALY
jgi:tRNA(adenine34) deaminase